MWAQQGESRISGTWCFHLGGGSVVVGLEGDRLRVEVVVSLFEVKGNVLWQKREVGEDVERVVQGISRDKMAFAQMDEGEEVCGEVRD